MNEKSYIQNVNWKKIFLNLRTLQSSKYNLLVETKPWKYQGLQSNMITFHSKIYTLFQNLIQDCYNFVNWCILSGRNQILKVSLFFNYFVCGQKSLVANIPMLQFRALICFPYYFCSKISTQMGHIIY